MSVPVTAPPAPSSLSQPILRSAQIVGLLGALLGSVMLTISWAMGASTQEASTFQGVGLAALFCSSLWSQLLFSRAMRMDGRRSPAFRWGLCMLSVYVLALFIWCSIRNLDWAVAVLVLSGLSAPLSAGILTNLLLRRWTPPEGPKLPFEVQRLKASRFRFIFLMFLLPVLFIPIPLVFACFLNPIPGWHQTILTRLPQPLSDVIYENLPHDYRREFMIKGDAVSAPILIEEMHAGVEDGKDIYTQFDSLRRQKPTLALKEAMLFLQGQEPYLSARQKARGVGRDYLTNDTYWKMQMAKFAAHQGSQSEWATLVEDEDFQNSTLFLPFLQHIHNYDDIRPQLKKFLLQMPNHPDDVLKVYVSDLDEKRLGEFSAQVWSEGKIPFWYAYASYLNETWGKHDLKECWVPGVRSTSVETRRAAISAIPYAMAGIQAPDVVKHEIARLLDDPDLIVRRMAARHICSWIQFHKAPTLIQINKSIPEPPRLFSHRFLRPEDPIESDELAALKETLKDFPFTR